MMFTEISEGKDRVLSGRAPSPYLVMIHNKNNGTILINTRAFN